MGAHVIPIKRDWVGIILDLANLPDPVNAVTAEDVKEIFRKGVASGIYCPHDTFEDRWRRFKYNNPSLSQPGQVAEPVVPPEGYEVMSHDDFDLHDVQDDWMLLIGGWKRYGHIYPDMDFRNKWLDGFCCANGIVARPIPPTPKAEEWKPKFGDRVFVKTFNCEGIFHRMYEDKFVVIMDPKPLGASIGVATGYTGPRESFSPIQEQEAKS